MVRCEKAIADDGVVCESCTTISADLAEKRDMCNTVVKSFREFISFRGPTYKKTVTPTREQAGVDRRTNVAFIVFTSIPAAYTSAFFLKPCAPVLFAGGRCYLHPDEQQITQSVICVREKCMAIDNSLPWIPHS